MVLVNHVHIARCEPEQLNELLDDLVLLLKIEIQKFKLRVSLQGLPVDGCFLERSLDDILETDCINDLYIGMSSFDCDLLLYLLFAHRTLVEKLAKGLGVNQTTDQIVEVLFIDWRGEPWSRLGC